MNCPLCGSEIPAGTKYCPTCGTDVEVRLQQQAAAQQTVPQQPMPRPAQARPQSQPPQPQPRPRPAAPASPQGRAVAMNPSMPPQQQNARFDTSKMSGGSPKWPFILIGALVVVIAIVVLLILQPWNQAAPAAGPDGNGADAPAVEPVNPDAANGADGTADAGAQGGATVTDTPPAPAGLSDADAYTQLSNAYNQFDGFNQRIGEIVGHFNGSYPDGADAATVQSWLDSANALRGELAAQTEALNAITLAEGSAYVQTLANIKQLNTDLVMRITDLADALQAWSTGEGDVGAILTRSNGADGVSTYKADYDALYPNAAPAAPAQ